MNLLLILAPLFILNVFSQNTESSPTVSLNCGYLGESYTFSSGISYDGECCNTDALEYMDKEHPGWRKNNSQLQQYLSELYQNQLCVGSTTIVLSSTTTVPQTTTTKSFLCSLMGIGCPKDSTSTVIASTETSTTVIETSSEGGFF
ncbi:hypothetical protein GCK72_004828 [Caenorhabditis remanei]|uniref:Uncharacterized protein n=1 Tax=Caenorhabditis remanei TaxID=31234 RepID=A0A6A5HCH5_CAERE|nr:hypothetical protein GCK72_004828 [Caenorhabditis remanei]KAF1764877.1 hypothetical protein GCK72_004828 [Caenorhabditis remanei]